MKKKTTSILKVMAILLKIKDGYNKFEKHLTGLNKARRKKYLNLWYHLTFLGDKYEESRKDKQTAFKIAFGSIARFSIRAINQRLRELAEQIKQFILQIEANESALGELSKAKLHHKLNEDDKRDEALERVLEKAPKADRAQRYFAVSQSYRFQYYKGKGDKLQPATQELLDKAEEASALGHYSESLKASIERLTYLRAKDEDIPDKLTRKLQHQFALLAELSCPLIEVQIKGIEFFLKPSLNAYYAYKTLYFNKVDELGEEKEHLLLVITNALVLIQPFFDNIMEEYCAIYQFAIENRVFASDEFMDRELFDNIVFVIRSYGDVDLLRRFINEHDVKLRDEKDRENCTLFAKCYLKAMEGKYLTAFLDLESVKPTYPVFKLRKQALQFICFYEKTRDKQEFYVYLKEKKDSFKRNLRYYSVKGDIRENQKKEYQNLLKFMYRIAKQGNADITADELSALLVSFKGIITERIWIEATISAYK